MSEPGQAVFLSYASQDAEAAKRICEALRAAGVEVWFDQSELVGGDAWDQKIRRQIKECALLIPIISKTTQGRREAYFRLEWRLADERTHLMAKGTPFLLPVTIDETSDRDALVPDSFLAIQWTKAPGGAVPPAFCARVKKLLEGEAPVEAGRPRPATTRGEGTPPPEKTGRAPRWLKPVLASAALVIIALGVTLWQRSHEAAPAGPVPPAPAAPAPASGIPPGGASPALSEARRLADRGFAMSVEKYDSSLDDFNAAEDLIKRALVLDPNDGEIWARSAQLNLMFRNRGFDFSPERIAAGRQQAERAIRLAPDSVEALFAETLAQRYTGNRAGAFESLQRVVKLDPNHARALLDLGSALASRGRMEEALPLLARARQRPQWAALADYFEYLGRFGTWRLAEADRMVRRSFATGPSANNASGVAVMHLTWDGDLDEAAREIAALPPSLRNAPRVAWIAAQVQLSRHAPEEALQVLDRLADDYFQDSWATSPKAILVGRAHAQAGREAAARIAWTAGLPVVEAKLKAEPGDPTLHNCRGELLAWLGRTDEALEEARAVAEINRGPAPVWTQSEARIYAILGRADLAIPALKALIKPDTFWPVTPTLLRLDPLWDKIRGDPRFQELLDQAQAQLIAAAPPRDWPRDPELKRAVSLLDGLEAIPEDFRLAEEILQGKLEKAPTDGEATSVMARVQSMWLLRGWDRSPERYQKAKSTAERAVQLAPDDPEALASLGTYVYTHRGEEARGRQALERAIQLVPNEPRFYRIRDDLMFFQPGVTQAEALASAERTARLFPRDALVHYELSRDYRNLARWADFERETDATLALAPIANALVWKARAEFAFRGDLAAMKATLDRVPERVRAIERTVFTYFVYAAMSNRPQEGLDVLETMADSWMVDFDYIGPKELLAAELLELQGKHALARVRYEAALAEMQRHRAAEPGNEGLYAAEAWILRGLGREEEARVAYRVVLDSQPHPVRGSPMNSWWFQTVPFLLLAGDRAGAVELLRELVGQDPRIHARIRQLMQLDKRMAPFREDPEINALLAEPSAAHP
ncbi:MAG TPA: TIR domain-containing protein [Lacunisphaera sp.]|nr:TIR domain-containing protein [Lacunisphaera sp.]